MSGGSETLVRNTGTSHSTVHVSLTEMHCIPFYA